MSYQVFVSETVEKKVRKFAPHLRKKLKKLKRMLEKNPFTGKPLRYNFFREKKWGPFRVYYLIIKDMLIVFIIEFGEKKGQQRTIDYILMHLDRIIAEIRKKYR